MTREELIQAISKLEWVYDYTNRALADSAGGSGIYGKISRTFKAKTFPCGCVQTYAGSVMVPSESCGTDGCW